MYHKAWKTSSMMYSLCESTNLGNEPLSMSPVHGESTQEAHDDQATNPVHFKYAQLRNPPGNI